MSDGKTPLVVVPSTFTGVTEAEWHAAGVNIVIYANQLLRSAFPSMVRTAETILRTGRAKEADADCLPIGDGIRLIPESMSFT